MNIQNLIQMGQQMQSQMSQIQKTLGSKEVSASSGGGMVTAVVDGKGAVKSVSIDSTVVDPGDVEMLEDLILAAINQAQQRAQDMMQEEMGQVTGGIQIPGLTM